MRRSAGRARTILLAVTALTVASGWATSGPPAATDVVAGRSPAFATFAEPAALTGGAGDLRAGPEPVALELHLPSINVTAAVLGVGITPANVMDAPTGPMDDGVWQQAFWYRGSAVPGAASTALIAGHVSGAQGRPAVFADIDQLRLGDPIVVRDTRTGLDVRFAVTESRTYSLAEAAGRDVLTRIYGAGPVDATAPQPSPDGVAHLTLITCAGSFRNGTHDHRLAVYATRVA